MFEAWTVRQAQVSAEEEHIRHTLQQMPDAQRLAFYQRYQPAIKDPDTYAALNWFFVAGLHNFYVGQWLAGLFDLVLMLLGVGLLFVAPAIGIALLVLVALIELPTLLRSQVIVAHLNNQIALRLLGEQALADV
ncbi:hypothetical protein [Marinomonas ostreistagni]|uniref:hypothetical protein n=1 Tax=Marinomonas ostreistagni TaxID=359209 RepID=UPI001950C46C|nr:hypothetical protein [Marinomonas ostreistagni]MBM6550911.1 hypothetical protein [Marinomonas ostreistagni]